MTIIINIAIAALCGASSFLACEDSRRSRLKFDPIHSLNYTKWSNRRTSNGPDKYGGDGGI